MHALIAFAGLDGAGKTTQARRLAEELSDRGFETALDAPQGPSFISKLLEDLVHHLGTDDLSNYVDVDSACLLRAILRYRDWSQSVLPALSRVEFGVTDRYASCYYASIRARNASVEPVLRTIFRNLPTPELTIFLDVPPAEAYQRLERRGVDLEKIEFLIAYDRAYRSLPEFAGFTVIDGRGTIDTVSERIRAAVRAKFPERFPLPVSRRTSAPGDLVERR